MEGELDGVFSAEIDEEFGRNLNCSEHFDHMANGDGYFTDPSDTEALDDAGKKSTCCLDCLKALWATRKIEIVQDKERVIRTTVRGLIIHLAFIGMVLTIALLPTIFLETYFFTDILQQITFPLDSSDEEAFTKIDNRPAMWNYILSGFLTFLYNEKTENRLVGRPRIRQIRVVNIDCQLPKSMSAYLMRCYPTFTSDFESHEPIASVGNQTIALSGPAWRWRSESESGSGRVAGTMATYPGSGYYLDLEVDGETTALMLQELYQGQWTGEATRAIIIDFTLYNANLNFFSVGQLLFETPYTGGVIASVDLYPLHLIRQHSTSEYIIFVCEVISLLFVAYYLYKEIKSISKMGLSYFRHFWHLIDLLVISLSVACVCLNVYNRVIVTNLLSDGISPNGAYPEFGHIGYISLQYKRLLAILGFFSLIQIFKFVSSSETMGQLTATINYATYDMIGFTIMFGIVFAAFVQAGTLMFGTTSFEFKSFDLTAFALYRIILGDFDMTAIKAAHIFLGPLYFIIYIFFVFFVLLNMFLAIIGEAYAKVKEDMAKRKNDFKFIGYIRYNTKEFFARFSKRRRMPLDKVLESAGVGDQMELTFGNWRRAMKNAGYSELETNFLFHKYDKDGDNMLDFVERRRMREDFSLGIAFQPPDSEDENTKADDHGKSQELKKDLFADPEDCEELIERIGDVEEGVNTAVKYICSILSKMEHAERQRREDEHALLKGII